MQFRASAILIVVLATTGNLYAENIDFGNVVFANVLYRHGDRTPIRPYSKDPYSNESLWSVPFGELTNLGKHQHLMLGRWLRKRYNHLLSEAYSPYEIYVRSSNVNRTLMSAAANLAGLYPRRGNHIWDPLRWMPIPVHTIPLSHDYLLAGNRFCPRYEYEIMKVLQSPEIQRINKDNAELFNYLTENSGDKVENVQTLAYLYNTLYVQSVHHKTLPKWTNSVYPDKLEPLASVSFIIMAYNRLLVRLRIGSLLGEMVDHMKQKSTKVLVPDRKVWIYSGHDDNISCLLMALNVFEPHWPPYASAILVELRENSRGQHIVTVSYKNSTAEPTLLTIPGCLAACPLENFVNLTKDVVPENLDRECLGDSSI